MISYKIWYVLYHNVQYKIYKVFLECVGPRTYNILSIRKQKYDKADTPSIIKLIPT